MNNSSVTHSLPNEYYVLQINGEVKSGHRLYVDALKAALQLKRQFPLSVIKVRDTSDRMEVPTV